MIGIREEILDWVPEDRTRYSRLGAIVINTGVMAALSLLVALHSITNIIWIALLPFALFWGYLIVSFDGWLVSTTHGNLDGRRKVAMFVPRLAVSMLFGFIIAEPLVFQIFQPAIHAEVRATRNETIGAHTTRYRQCNPETGEVVTDPGCRNFLLNVPDSPLAARTELTTLTAQRDKLSGELTASSGKLAELVDHAAKECAGTPGPGLTGVPGNGTDCGRDRTDADQFRADNNIDQRQQDLRVLDQKVKDSTAKTAAAEKGYQDNLRKAIEQNVTKQSDDQGPIGLLDEEHALASLSSRSWAVCIAQWLLRLLFIVIDCLPALAKLASGTTAYDRLFSRQIQASSALFDRWVAIRERQDSAEYQIAEREIEHRLHNRLEEIDDADRSHRAQREIDKREQIASLADRLQMHWRAG
ncbi:DUF4407 domain-containing protein [Nocardia nova]|nr:DUF4407 domain-containing protein [Nocardia nova]